MILVLLLSYVHCLTSVNHQLPERASSKKEFGDKLLLSEITSVICISKGEQVWTLGAERLLSLKVKFNKY